MCCKCAVQTDGAALRAVRSGLIRATLHMVNREFGELAADFVALGCCRRAPTGPPLCPR